MEVGAKSLVPFFGFGRGLHCRFRKSRLIQHQVVQA